MFWRPKESMKGNCYVFSGYKQRKKFGFVNLEHKLQHDMYRWSVFRLKDQKTAEWTYLETAKQQTRFRWCF